MAGGGWHSLCRMNTDTEQYVLSWYILIITLTYHMQMIKHLKILLSRVENGSTIDYAEKSFDTEDGSGAIDVNLFVGSSLLLKTWQFTTFS